MLFLPLKFVGFLVAFLGTHRHSERDPWIVARIVAEKIEFPADPAGE